jgi:DNA-binding transcriptional MerR regulator
VRIGEVAERAGVSVRALRYYEEQGLLITDREPSGHRRYAESAVPRVKFIQLLYSAGLTSKTVTELLPFMDSGVITGEMLGRLTDEHARLRTRIDELTQAHDQLGELIAASPHFRQPGTPMPCLEDQ